MSEKANYDSAVKALRARLDLGGKVVTAQDFRHLAQSERETVTEFIRRLERTFRIAYGRDGMSKETRDALLHSQLQESLRQEVMSGPAVSGAATYSEHCIAAKNEERRLAGLKKREQYRKPGPETRTTTSYSGKGRQPPSAPSSNPQSWAAQHSSRPPSSGGTRPSGSGEARRCYTCNKLGHLSKDCRTKTESRGPPQDNRRPQASSQVTREVPPLPMFRGRTVLVL